MASNIGRTMARPSLVTLADGRLDALRVRNLNEEVGVSDRPEITASFLAPGRTRISNSGSEISILLSKERIGYNGRFIAAGSVIFGEGTETNVELAGLGVLLRGRPQHSDPVLSGGIRAIDEGSARGLMEGGVSPVKLIVPELRKNERPWSNEMWRVTGNGRDAAKPVITSQTDRLQFSLTDGAGKETYHRHNFTTEVFAMLEGRMRVWSVGIAEPSFKTLEAPFVLAIKPGMSHMCLAEGVSYVLQMSAPNAEAGYQMPIRYDRMEYVNMMAHSWRGNFFLDRPLDPNWIEWNE